MTDPLDLEGIEAAAGALGFDGVGPEQALALVVEVRRLRAVEGAARALVAGGPPQDAAGCCAYCGADVASEPEDGGSDGCPWVTLAAVLGQGAPP